MIFKTTEELKIHFGQLYKSVKFDNLKHDIINATDDIISIIGKKMYDNAETHYLSDKYNGTNPSEKEKLLDMLVFHIQAPIAFYAYSAYSQNGDVTHEDSGRRVKIDPNTEKIPFEWLLIRDDEATLNKAHKATERLLKFLDFNIAAEPFSADWKGSDAYKLAHSLFINSAEKFDSIYPIDKSRRLFLKLAPFIDDIEIKVIKPIIGKSIFDDLKTKMLTPDQLTESDAELLTFINTPLALHTMALAINRLPIEVLPNGIFQNEISLTQNSKKPASIELIRKVSANIKNDANIELDRLTSEIAKRNALAAGIAYEPYNHIDNFDSSNKFFRL